MKIYYLIHADFEGLGAIEYWALNNNHTLHGFHTYRGDKLPIDTCDADLLIVMGGPQDLTDLKQYPYIEAEINFVKKMIDSDTLVLGICLGSQIISLALGGIICRSPHRELGKFDVCLTQEGGIDKIFSHLPQSFSAFHWHNDMPGLVDGMKILAFSDGCPIQAYKYQDTVYALQCHLELTPDLVENMIAHSPTNEFAPSKYVQSISELKQINCSEINQFLFTILDHMMRL